MTTRTLGVAILMAGMVGCDDVSSDDVLTSGIYADIGVSADGSGTATATAILKVGGNGLTFLDLADGDTLTATPEGGESQPMNEIEIVEVHAYQAVLDDDTPGVPVTVAFNRTLDAGAPNTTVTLPEPFTADEPAAQASRAADLVLTWDAGSSDDMWVYASGDCINVYTEQLDEDDGEYTIDAGSITPVEGMEADSCGIEISLTRKNVGTLDAGYGEGGVASGSQVRKVSTTSVP